MSKELEHQLKLEAIKKGFSPKGKKFGAYVYGTLRKTEWKPGK